MKKFIITEELVQGLLSYLQEQPYKMVYKGVEILSTLPELKETDGANKE